MNVGMLWFDDDPKTNIDLKVERAAQYYSKKYGKSPTLCFVHPTMMPTLAESSNNGCSEAHKTKDNGSSSEIQAEARSYISCGIEVRSNNSVLPNHFWIGVNGASEAEPTIR